MTTLDEVRRGCMKLSAQLHAEGDQSGDLAEVVEMQAIADKIATTDSGLPALAKRLDELSAKHAA